MTFILLFLAAALLSYLLAYPVRATALRFDIVDYPEKRKMHQIPIPLMGGLAVALSFGAVSAFAVLASGSFDAGSVRSYMGWLAGGSLILCTGLYDDIVGLKPKMKFAGQLLAALTVVAMGARIDLFTNPLGDSVQIGWLGIPLTVFWIVGVTNAVNLIDGLDGLAVGIGGIAALGLFAVSAAGSPFLATLAIILAGATAGFLPHNFYPARLFMGDTGSMFIGYTLAVIGLLGSYKATTATVLFLPIIVLGMPLFDTMFAIFRRARRRVSPFKADREHIHHRLVRIGLHHRNVVLVLYFVCAYLALTAYAIAQFPYQTAFLFLVVLTMGGVIGLRTLRFIEERFEIGIQEATAAKAGSTAGRNGKAHRPGNGRAKPREMFTLTMCDVGGFHHTYGGSEDLRALCGEINAMLSRRLRVDAIHAEPAAPGHVVLLIRTEPLKAPMQAQVQDGLSWLLEDQRDRFGGTASFPRIRWIPATSPADVPSDGERPAAHPAPREQAAVPFRDGRVTVAGS